MTLIEALIAATVMAVVLLGMGLYQSATLRSNQQEKWRTLALQKSVQMMQEIVAFQSANHASSPNGLDSLDDKGKYNYVLTIDPLVTMPTVALSGNPMFKSGYRLVRQISVKSVPNDANSRLVTVSVFLADGNVQPKALYSKPLATVTNLLSSTPANYSPTQVYDVYFINIENAGWQWQDPVTLERNIKTAVDGLQANNTGLQIRTHIIRRLSYGRDNYYMPYLNRNLPVSTAAGTSDPLNWAYFYPGNADNAVYTYNPSVMGGQIELDGNAGNTWPRVGAVSSYYENAAGYSFADQYNNAVRYPDELMKFAKGGGKGEPSLRMLLDQLASGQLMNAIIVNLHGEVLPMPPGRNYSDAAKVPQDTASTPMDFQNQWGVSGVTQSSDVVDGSRVRLVTHPRLLSVNLASTSIPNVHSDYPVTFPSPGSPNDSPNNTVELRVYPHLTSGFGTEPASQYRNGQVVVRGLQGSILTWALTAMPTPAPTAPCGTWYNSSGHGDEFYYGPYSWNPDPSDSNWMNLSSGHDGVGAAGYYYHYDTHGGIQQPNQPTSAAPNAPACGATPGPTPMPTPNGTWKKDHNNNKNNFWGPLSSCSTASDPHDGANAGWQYLTSNNENNYMNDNGPAGYYYHYLSGNASVPTWTPAFTCSTPAPTPTPTATPTPGTWIPTDITSVEIDVCDNGGSGAFTWKRIWPYQAGSFGVTNLPPDAVAYSTFLATDPVFAAADDPSKDIHQGDLIIKLASIPYTNPVATSTGGLKLHGLNYFPDAQLPALDHVPSGTMNNEPYNTARFRILFKVKSTPTDPVSGDSGYLRVLTTIGDDPVLFHHQAPNRSETFVWVGQQPPYEETYQLQGDPRDYPYEDPANRDQRDPYYNPYFKDLTGDKAYLPSSGGQSWNTFAKTSNGWGSLAGGKVNYDVPRYYERWRQALLGSNALFVNPSGGLGMSTALGGEKTVHDGKNNLLTISGTPFYGGGTAQPDDFKGNGTSPNPAACLVGKLDTSSNVTWYAKPWLGELYPDDQWSSWKTSGNLPAPQFRLLDYTALPADCGNFVHLMSGGPYGEVAFFDGTTGGGRSSWAVQETAAGGTGTSSSTGTSMLASFNTYAAGTLKSELPMNLASTDGSVKPPEWSSTEWGTNWATTLSWGLSSGPTGYYTEVSPASDGAVAPVAIMRASANGYVLVDDMDDPNRQSLASLSLVSTLEAFFDTGNTTFGSQAAKLVPRAHIDAPAPGSTLSNSKHINWSYDWTRWNTMAYSNLVTNYGSSGNKPTLRFNLKYSPDSGASWYFIQNHAPAREGVLDASGSHLLQASDSPYNWDTTTVPNGNYLVRLECFRNDPGTKTVHYAYHQQLYTVSN